MERASTAFFLPRHKCSVHGFVTNGASTYTKKRGGEQDLYQHDNFPSLRLMTGTDCGDQGEHKKERRIQVLAEC